MAAGSRRTAARGTHHGRGAKAGRTICQSRATSLDWKGVLVHSIAELPALTSGAALRITFDRSKRRGATVRLWNCWREASVDTVHAWIGHAGMLVESQVTRGRSALRGGKAGRHRAGVLRQRRATRAHQRTHGRHKGLAVIRSIDAPAADALIRWLPADQGGRQSGPPTAPVYAADCTFPLGGETETSAP